MRMAMIDTVKVVKTNAHSADLSIKIHGYDYKICLMFANALDGNVPAVEAVIDAMTSSEMARFVDAVELVKNAMGRVDGF